MNHKYISILLFSIFIFSAGVVLADEETIDLPAAGLTPQSPFYFLDRVGDWARLNVWTFNPVKKARIKTEIAEERLAELNNVVAKAPDRADIIEKLETAIQKRVEEANNDAERLDGQNRDVSNVVEKLEAFNLKQQLVLENAIERIPDQAKDRTEKALENIHKQAKKHREILLKQKEKGFISEERAGIVIQNGLVNLKNQLEHRKERIEEIEDEALKKRLENVIEKKIEALEVGILDLESKEGFKEAREKIKDVKKDVIKSILQARRELKLRATTTEETLEQIHEENFHLKERAEKLIREAEENILRAENTVQEMKNNDLEIPNNALVLLNNAKEHLINAKRAFEEAVYGRAFGAANSAWQNIKNVGRTLEKIWEGHRNFPEKSANLKKELAELENKIQSLGGNIPDDIHRLLKEAKEEIEKAEILRAESAFEKAWDHLEIAKRIIDKLRPFVNYLMKTTEEKTEAAGFNTRPAEEQRVILKKKLDEAKEARRIENFERKREALRELPAAIAPEEKEMRICAQVITPARNVRTKECGVFRNSCLPKGWERDKGCEIDKDYIEKPSTIPSEVRLKQIEQVPSVEQKKEQEQKTSVVESQLQESADFSEPEKVIDIVARQWSFAPETILVKRGTKVILNIKSIDVTHGFSLPEFGINVDLSPGKTEKVEFIAEKTGKFPFRCSVFCGAGHPKMTGLLIVE